MTKKLSDIVCHSYSSIDTFEQYLNKINTPPFTCAITFMLKIDAACFRFARYVRQWNATKGTRIVSHLCQDEARWHMMHKGASWDDSGVISI